MRQTTLLNFYNTQTWAHSLALTPGTNIAGSWGVTPQRTERTTSPGTPVGGAGSLDGAFLLSEADVLQLFPNNTARRATFADGGSAQWWLRSPGTAADVMIVNTPGNLGSHAPAGHTTTVRGIRPALLLSELP